MIILLSFCTFPWWLAWLLPFLLGLALGWALWAKYKNIVTELEDKVSSLNVTINGLEDDLASCRSRRADLEGQLAIANGRIRELDLALAGKNQGSAALKSSTKDSSSSSKSDKSDKSDKIDKIDLSKTKSSASANIASNLGAAASLTSKTDDVGSKKTTSTSATPGQKAMGFAGLKEDNLQIVEGIGPKMNSILNDHKILTWGELAKKSPEDLRGILNTYGDKYRIIDPSTWSAQAALARDNKWEELIKLQKQLDGGKAEGAVNETDSKLEKIMIKLRLIKKWKKDDLKAVEGIGPKIEGLLHAAGIKTWEALAKTEVSKIQKILDNAGSRYSLADPGTWPKQSGMAAEGKWKDLDEYQDYLKGGKEK